MENLEAPIVTPEYIKPEIKNTKDIFELEYNKEIYTIQISTNTNDIEFTASSKNTISNLLYENSFDLKQLSQFSKIFKLCDNIQDALDIILPELREKRVSIILEDKNFYLNFTFTLPNIRKDTVKILLKSKILDNTQIINKLCQRIGFIEEKNNNLENKIKTLEKEINNLKERKNNKVKRVCDFISKKFYKSKGEVIFDLKTFLTDNIFELSEEYKAQILKDFNSKAKIIFNTEIDEDTVSNFFSKVYGKSNIVCFISLILESKRKGIVPANFFLFLKEKLELQNDVYDLNNKIILIFGNCQDNIEEYKNIFFALNNEKWSFLIKKEKDCVHVNSKIYELEIEFLIKDNFLKNDIIYEVKGEKGEDHAKIKIDELIIYQIDKEK